MSSVPGKPGYGLTSSPDYGRVGSEQHQVSHVWGIEVCSSLLRLLREYFLFRCADFDTSLQITTVKTLMSEVFQAH